MRLLLLFVLFLSVSVGVRAGGPWVPGHRKGFVQLGGSGLYYNAVFSPTGRERSVARNVSDLTLQLYAEYGLAPRWEIRAVLPYKRLQTGRSTDPALNPIVPGTLTGVGNVGLGLKYALLDGPFKLSAGVDGVANTFRNNDRLGLRTGFEGWTVLPYLSLGAGGKRTYFFVETGFGLMTQEYSNFLKINGELGYRIVPRLWIGGTLDFRLPLKNGRFTNTEPYLLSGTYLNNQQFLGAGLKMAFDIVPTRLGLAGSVIGALSGQNVPFSRSYNAGIFIKW